MVAVEILVEILAEILAEVTTDIVTDVTADVAADITADVIVDVSDRTELKAQVEIRQPKELKVLQKWFRVLMLPLILVFMIYKDSTINKTRRLF